MKLVAITGRSGCGKSQVARYYASLGLPTLDADQVARQVLEPGSACLAALQHRFGADILRADGTLDRQCLADRAFATPQGAQALTHITHPEIVRRILAWAGQAGSAQQPLCFVDGAVIVGGLLQPHCWRIVLVTAPQEVSVQRICARDGITATQARRRLAAQLSERQLRDAADYLIHNDSDPDRLAHQASQVLERLRKELYAPQSH